MAYIYSVFSPIFCFFQFYIPFSISLLQLLNKSIHAVNSQASDSVAGNSSLTMAFLFSRASIWDKPKHTQAPPRAAFFIDPVMDERLVHLFLCVFVCSFFYSTFYSLCPSSNFYFIFFYLGCLEWVGGVRGVCGTREKVPEAATHDV